MTMKKFITMDLQTGKKILQTIEASYIKFSDNRLPDSPQDLDTALKAEITRALAAEKKLTADLAQEVKDARKAEEAIKTLIGDLGQQDASVKAAIDRIDRLITELTSKVNGHIADTNIHITADERTKWNKVTEDILLKADRASMATELDKKVAKEDLFAGGKIKTEHLPSIAINSVTTVDSVEAALRLPIENGDVVIINPDIKVAKTQKQVVTGTFICVDDTQTTFEKKFRQLYSNSDSISKADVEKLIKVETDRADAVEKELAKDITVINGEDNVAGSIKHAVKLEKERAEGIERDLNGRLQTVETTVTKLDGDISTVGSAANLANKALIDAKAHTNTEIGKVNTAAEALSGKVTILETKVGNDQQGLVKDVKDLQTKVNVINGEQEGSIKKALVDAKKYTEQQVTAEAQTRKEADDALGRRIDSLEASEEFKVSLGFAGAEKGDLLAVKANGQSVKATLEEDSRVVGIVVVADGTNSKTAVMGKVGGFENLTPGKSYFLGANGKITTAIPTTVGQHIVKVGVAISATELFVNIEEPIEIRE